MTDPVNDLILSVYDAVADPDRWQPALDRLVDATGAHGSIIFEWADLDGTQKLTAPIHSGRYPSSMIGIYLDKCTHFEARDQDVLRKHTKDHDRVELLDDTLLAGSVEELRQQDHVQLLNKLGIFHRAAGIMNKDNRWISLFSLQLGANRHHLTEAERVTLSKILPHLAKALDLSIPTRQLQHRYKSVLAAIDKLTIGICILDAKGRIVARNEEFRRQQEAYRTFRASSDGVLRLTDNHGQKRLSELMSHTLHHGQFGARPRKESVLSHTDDVLCVEIAPLHRSEEIGSTSFDGFIVCSTDTSLPIQFNAGQVQKAFGLTRSEMALIEPISQGLTNPEIADRRGRSVATVNSQTKSILAKSNCSNRTQLVRMMMRFGASFLVKNKNWEKE